jgi:hypothetical protein
MRQCVHGKQRRVHTDHPRQDRTSNNVYHAIRLHLDRSSMYDSPRSAHRLSQLVTKENTMKLEMKHLRISLLSLAIVIVSVLIVLKAQQHTFKIGDTVRIDTTGQLGRIVSTYEYNNYHETNLHTGYLVSLKNENQEFDEPTFTLVKHK